MALTPNRGPEGSPPIAMGEGSTNEAADAVFVSPLLPQRERGWG
jgi:hypothetical protein